MGDGGRQKGLQEQIGRRIRNMRKRRGLTQEELGDAAGVTGKFIGTVERGEMYPSMQKLEDLSQALLCDIHYFLERDFGESGAGDIDQTLSARLADMSAGEKKMLLRLIDGLLDESCGIDV